MNARRFFGLMAQVMLTLAVAVAAGAQDATQRLRPWASLPADGQLPPEHRKDLLNTSADYNTRPADRQARTINREWTFNYFPAETLDEQTVAPGFDDARWPAVAMPHTWQTYETTGDEHPFNMIASEADSPYWWNGWGVYRKVFTPNKDLIKAQKVFIEFDGVMKYCKVFLNGKLLGEHRGGYTSFYFDLTDHLRPDVPNLLAVAVSNRRDDPMHIPPMTAGNFNVYGGIYRDVRIVVKRRVYIPFQGSSLHEGGTFITTPEVSAGRATVRVRTWVKNETSESLPVTLLTTIGGRPVQGVTTKETTINIAPGELHEFDQTGFVVEHPQLWSPETPALYSVSSKVSLGAKNTDTYESPLGFRTFTWDFTQNRGVLNGKVIHIHGTNRHQEFPWLGDAIPKWMHVRDLFDIRFGLGHNFARFAHYTHDSLVYDLADRWGILVCEETPSIKNLKFNPEVQHQMVTEMIRRDRNHPSIVMWSMGNETDYPADSAWAHAEDDTRLIHLRHGNAARAGQFVTHTDKNMDMENLLRCTVRGWTDHDAAPLEPKTGQSTGNEEWQHQQARIAGASQRGSIDMPNGVMWIYADHGADREYANCPLWHINPKGWVDIDRIPKYMYYLWQANYAAAPMAFIHPEAWQAKNIGQKRDIVVDSNCPEVELKVNGRSVGTQRNSAENFHTVKFSKIPVERGALEVVATSATRKVVSRVVMNGEPARLTLSASHTALAAARDALAVITVDAVDAAGVPVQGFSRTIHWSVSGPARLLTPATFTSDIAKRGEMSGTFYIVTPVCTLIRATGQAGEITVTATAEGLPPATLKIPAKAKPAPQDFVNEPALNDAGRQPVAKAPPESAPKAKKKKPSKNKLQATD